MTSILFESVKNYRPRVKWNYLQKTKLFVLFFCHFRNLNQILNISRETMIVISTSYIRTSLDHSLKYTFSEHLLTVNMLKGQKLLQKKHEGTFLIFFHHSDTTWFGKYLPQLYVKPEGCFLTHCLPMTSLQFGIVKIFTPNSKAIVFKTKNFSPFFLPFLESTSNFKHFEKKRWSS